MKEFFKKSLIYLIMSILVLPTWLVTGIHNAPHAKAASMGDNILISEIQIDGGITTDEFVELHNPTLVEISITGWRLNRKTGGGTESILVSSLSGSIPSGGYYLIAHDNFDGIVIPDINYSNSIAPNNTVVLYSDAGVTIVDKVGMGTAIDAEGTATSVPGANKSIERFPGYPTANSVDTDNNVNDFFTQSDPNPRNSDVDLPTVVDVTSVPSIINENNLNLQTTIDFSEVMNPAIDPTVTIGGLTSPYTIAGGIWDDADTWSGSVTIANDNETGLGVYNISLAEDLNGNEMEVDTNYSVLVDTSVPIAPIVSEFTSPINQSNENNVSLVGTGEANGILNYSIDDSNPLTPAVTGVIPIDASGNFKKNDIDVSSLDDGILNLTVNTTDSNGNQGSNAVASATKNSSVPAAPDFNIVKSEAGGELKVIVNWIGVGGGVEGYNIKIDGVLRTVAAKNLTDDSGINYSEEILIGDYGSYDVLVTSVKAGVESINLETQSVEFSVPVVGEITEPVATIDATKDVTEEPTISIAPQSVQAQEPQPVEEKIEPVPGDENGIIKGDENANEKEENINWTPWIVLFVLIILAGAATGGYFYWFNGGEEIETEVRTPKKETKISESSQKSSSTKNKRNKKSRRW